jgi:uncharacterized protein (DUF305 family)
MITARRTGRVHRACVRSTGLGRRSGGTAFDVLFCQLMLRHHLGGIHMAEAIGRLSHDRQVRDLAAAITRAQQGEVRIFQDTTSPLTARRSTPRG